MPAYCLFDIHEIHDEAAMSECQSKVPATVESFGGEYVVIGGPWQVVEGDWRPSFPVMITFPDMAAANAWYDSDAYRELKALRLAAVTSDAVFMDSAGAEQHTAGAGTLEA